MLLSGTSVGFACVFALLMAAIFAAILERKEKAKGNASKSRFLSRAALILFLVAFVGGVGVTLLGGVRPRESEQGMMKKPMQMPMAATSGAKPQRAAIGQVDEKEMEALKSRIDQNPNDIAALERMGHLALQLQDFDLVFNLSHQALLVNPQSPEALTHMGMAYSAMQKKEKALEAFDKALKSDPKFSEAFLFKGMAQFQSNDLKGAKESWDQFMKVAKPDDPGRVRVEMFLKSIGE